MLLLKRRTAPYSCSAFPNRFATLFREHIRHCGCRAMSTEIRKGIYRLKGDIGGGGFDLARPVGFGL